MCVFYNKYFFISYYIIFATFKTEKKTLSTKNVACALCCNCVHMLLTHISVCINVRIQTTKKNILSKYLIKYQL